MAKYSDIKGFTVQTVSSDPAATQLDTGTWASGGDLNTARAGCTGTSDSTTNSIMMGGYYLPPTVNRSVTEAYDGTSWTELADIPISVVYGNGLGVKTASMVAGADISAAPKNSNAYIFDGSSWTAPGASLNTMKFMSATGGTTTAGIIAGGNNPPGTPKQGTTETWNGSAFTEVADLNTAKSDIGGGTGTSTALMSASGNPSTTEIYNGSSWTEIAELNTARQNASKGGTITAAIVSNGLNGGYHGKTEMYDGTSWTEVGDTPTSFAYAGNLSSGNSNGQNNSIIAGGQNNEGQTARTLEWTTTPSALFSKSVEGQLFFNSTANTFKETITDIPGATWASGGDVNTARYGMAASGDATNGVIAGGNDNGSPGYKNETEVYDGTSWTEVNNLNQTRGVLGATNSSPYTDSVAFGGYTGTANTGHTETWNGSSWTTSPASLNTARRYNGGLGAVSTNALCCGGKTSPSYPGPGHTAVESWDGSSWTEVAEFSTGRNESPVGAGTNTAAIIYGGQYPPGLNVRANTESFDGTSWTELNDLNTARGYMGGGGTQTIALAYGGRASPGALANTEAWNGTSWSEVNDISTARAEAGGSSNTGTSSALFSSGSAGPPSLPSATEEWTADLANKTITAS